MSITNKKPLGIEVFHAAYIWRAIVDAIATEIRAVKPVYVMTSELQKLPTAGTH